MREDAGRKRRREEWGKIGRRGKGEERKAQRPRKKMIRIKLLQNYLHVPRWIKLLTGDFRSIIMFDLWAYCKDPIRARFQPSSSGIHVSIMRPENHEGNEISLSLSLEKEEGKKKKIIVYGSRRTRLKSIFFPFFCNFRFWSNYWNFNFFFFCLKIRTKKQLSFALKMPRREDYLKFMKIGNGFWWEKN